MSMGDAAVTCIFERSLRLSMLSGEEGPREKMRSGGDAVVLSSSSSSSRIFWAAKSSSSIKVAVVLSARDCSRRGRSTAALENQLWRRKDIGIHLVLEAGTNRALDDEGRFRRKVSVVVEVVVVDCC